MLLVWLAWDSENLGESQAGNRTNGRKEGWMDGWMVISDDVLQIDGMGRRRLEML